MPGDATIHYRVGVGGASSRLRGPVEGYKTSHQCGDAAMCSGWRIEHREINADATLLDGEIASNQSDRINDRQIRRPRPWLAS